MLIELSYRERVELDLEVVSLELKAAASGEYSQFRFFVPNAVQDRHPRCISEDEPFLCWSSDPDFGAFAWWVDGFEQTPAGYVFQAYAIAKMFEKYNVRGSGRQYEGLTAGTLAALGLRDAIAGRAEAYIMAGVFTCAPPAIPLYPFKGQPYSQVLLDLMNLSGQEPEIDRYLRLNWIGNAGGYSTAVLTDGGGVTGSLARVSFSGMVSEVTGKLANGDNYTARL